MNELLWYTSRATGVASIVLLTVVLVLGLVTSGRRSPHGESATVVIALHRWLSLGMLVFLGAHIATAVAETYVSIDAVSALLPFTSGYETVWVGLGTLAFDILLAVGVTSALRRRLTERTWRRVHLLSYAMWPMALVHGLALGTANEPLLRGATIFCGLVGAGAIAWRWSAVHADQERRDAVAAQRWT
ncbi:ferric reductase-like transmembrane domain-containing protein [Intrasporangium sp. YIM S08009]|uniref:ferric reductase-like transmembrane domain-containing protein n=1 Tax=Intrasporangium zincisolvens TaxID=3080018 RepID=UPI002B0551BA|nr:ferric reductase-like transmembrane domain-containing protein [Intrasporangium sp. YIM S08009]